MSVSLHKTYTSPASATGRTIFHPTTGTPLFVTRAQRFPSQPLHVRLTFATPSGARITANIPVTQKLQVRPY